jgi:hypothetical protein
VRVALGLEWHNTADSVGGYEGMMLAESRGTQDCPLLARTEKGARHTASRPLKKSASCQDVSAVSLSTEVCRVPRRKFVPLLRQIVERENS